MGDGQLLPPGNDAVTGHGPIGELWAGAKADRVKYLVVWKLDHGSWKLHRDIWNPTGPA